MQKTVETLLSKAECDIWQLRQRSGRNPALKAYNPPKTRKCLEAFPAYCSSLYALNTSHFPNKLTTHPSRNWTVGTPNHYRFGGCPGAPRKFMCHLKRSHFQKKKTSSLQTSNQHFFRHSLVFRCKNHPLQVSQDHPVPFRTFSSRDVALECRASVETTFALNVALGLGEVWEVNLPRG